MEQKERKIYLPELIKYIKRNICKIIIGSVIFSIVFAAYMFISDNNKYESQKKDKDNVISLESLSYDEKKGVENIILMQDRVLFREQYMSKSYLMNMDVNNVQSVVMQCFVDSEYKFDMSSVNEVDYSSSLVEMYYLYLIGEDFSKAIMTELDAEYKKELFLVTPNYDAKTFSVTIYIPNGITAESVKETLIKLIAEKEKELQMYGKHTLVTLSENIYQGYDELVENKIYTARKTLSETKGQVVLLKEGLTELQQKYLKQYYNVEENNVITKPQISKKNIVVGFVLGLFVICCYYLIRSILSGKLQSTDDIRDMFDVNILRGNSGEEKGKYLAVKIKCICEKNGIDKLFFTGTMSVKNEMLDEITTLLEDENICIVKGNSVIDDADSYEKMCEISNVVIVEKLYNSRYNDIAEEVRLMADNGVNIVGAIVIE